MKDLKWFLGAGIVLATLGLTSFRPANAVWVNHVKKPTRAVKKSSWQQQLQLDIAELERLHPNQIGLYIKDLNTGEEVSLHAEESWYLASTVKVPIAIEVLRQVDEGKLTLDDKVVIKDDDYVDGGGALKSMKSGSKVSVRFLLEQMIIWSDNMASDMLLRTVGLENVNRLVLSIAPEGISSITTLKDVRRHLYGGLHPLGRDLPGKTLIELDQVRHHRDRVSRFTSLLKMEKQKLLLPNLHEAYEAYYKSGLNSGSPRSYSRILESVWEGNILSPKSKDYLVKTMLNTQTGAARIKAGLKSPLVFAHKTGTQYRRIGDVGYIMDPRNPARKPVIVVSFIRGIRQEQTSAKVLAKVAKIISRSGVL